MRVASSRLSLLNAYRYRGPRNEVGELGTEWSSYDGRTGIEDNENEVHNAGFVQ